MAKEDAGLMEGNVIMSTQEVGGDNAYPRLKLVHRGGRRVSKTSGGKDQGAHSHPVRSGEACSTTLREERRRRRSRPEGSSNLRLEVPRVPLSQFRVPERKAEKIGRPFDVHPAGVSPKWAGWLGEAWGWSDGPSGPSSGRWETGNFCSRRVVRDALPTGEAGNHAPLRHPLHGPARCRWGQVRLKEGGVVGGGGG